MIKTVFFDIGGVVYSSVSEKFSQIVKREFGIADCVPTNSRYDFVQDLFRKLETGSLDEQGFWQAFGQRTNKPLPASWPTLMEQVFSEQFARPSMVQLIKQLKSHGIGVFVLSNVGKEKAEENKKEGVYAIFDGEILSCEVHLWKPDKEIFLKAIEIARVLPAESLFIDDVLANVEGAKAIGMHAIQFTTEEQFFKDLEQFHMKYSFDFLPSDQT